MDTRNLNITGRDAERVLDSVGITVNKNAIPFDPASPAVTSGIRIGTPAVTTRGMGVEEMKIIGRTIAMTLKNPNDEATLQKAREAVRELTARFPIYPDLEY